MWNHRRDHSASVFLLTARYIVPRGQGRRGVAGPNLTGKEVVEGTAMRPNNESPGRGGTGRRIPRRTRFGAAAAAAVAAVLLAAGCSSSSTSSTSAPATSAPATTSAPAATSAAA